MKTILNVSMIQLDMVHQDVKKNRLKAQAMLDQAADARPDVVLLPETWTSGYSVPVFRSIRQYAEHIDGESVALLRRASEKYGFYLIGGSFAERDGDYCYNTVPVIGAGGALIGRYRKMHLYSAMDEDKAFRHGTEMPVFDSEFGKFSVMTCYDIRFLELSRTYALRGAHVIFVVSNFPRPKLHHWRTLLQARAIENQVYVVACNRVGAADTYTYFGHSMVIDPWGEIMAEGGEDECIVSATLDMTSVGAVRSKIPVYYDRRPESYPGDFMRPGLPAGEVKPAGA